MKRKIKLSFQIIVALLIVTLLAMLVTGCMIMFKGVGSKGTFTYMIILGNKIEGSAPSPLLRDRIEAAAKYMEKHPDVILIATGYQPEGAEISEARCIFNELTARGIDPERILLDDRAATTAENFQYSLELLEKKLGRVPHNIGVLSSEFHLLRAQMIARDYGLEPVTVAAATTDSNAFMTYFIREIFMVWYDGIRLALS